MFLPSSRYHNVATVEAVDADGRPVVALKLRRLAAAPGEPHTVEAGERLDILAQTLVGDATQFWHVADANTALDSRTLTGTAGDRLLLPKD